ncbi:helix-turn-helix domain-containing protein [Liquorilactobacillus hordei]|uniref:DOD-type homing endonuclease domain-containing protein n=1 Tax=Liquorilactobacillus hordei DSM 19519 TaxID=1423759 RepID=A0A0R1MJ10_9LACO|nr:helix-turn-helix domain-containing protein [Liquorilactobacillus hordei]KRL07950.1 hypothetical protein FC92_GL001018 [Liquorilactobacillus hordei DSM 19519]QYH51104.1 hypothetical protein G6O70_00660 [Liquorilactobacillus hordei DSM 19519]
MRIVTDEEKIKSVELYKKGLSTVKIGKLFNREPRTINRMLKSMGVEIRSNKINSRKHHIYNERYFNNIDTQEKAYLLGFIYADGFISINGNTKRFGISINRVDEYLLEFVRKELNTDYLINRYKVSCGYRVGVNYSRLLMTSDLLVDDLIKHGVVEHKTNILLPPKISNNLKRHFIRGYMDGDGSIKKCKGNYNYEYGIDFVGTTALLTWIYDYFLENNLISKRKINLEKRKKGQLVSHIRWGGNRQVLRILNHLYKDSAFCLNRKFDRYLQLMEQSSPIQE